MALSAIVHHTGLEFSGGATRVARLLMDGINEQGIISPVTFELAEGDDSNAIVPGAFGPGLSQAEIGHVHCTGNWPALLSSFNVGQKVVITLHDCELFTGGCPYPLGCQTIDADCANPCPRKFPDSEDLRKLKHQLIDHVDPVLVAPSRWLGRLAKSHLFRSVNVIPNGIPWPKRPMRQSEARRQLGINPVARVALFVAHGGTGAAYKSGQSWKTIWAALKKAVPEALCFAVGGDTAGRDGDLVIWPYVERDRLELLMAASDVLLYPTQADNHSLVVLEAMTQALPVLAYNVGGIPEQITDKQTGRLVEQGKQKEFIQVAADMLTNPAQCRDLGQAAFSQGQKRFTAERMVADYMKLYGQM
ncbi:glycosyltransferase [Pseudodesulfovibrio sp.]|nr:glycosyltransferase [Pseudodesulfovibrio sp.]